MEYLFVYLCGLGIGIAMTYVWWKRQVARLLPKPHPKEDTLQQVRQLLDRQSQEINLLQQQLETINRLLELVPLGYLAVDEDNRLCYVNHALQTLLPLSAGLGHPLIEVVRAWELDALVEQTRLLGKPQTQDWKLTSLTGKSHPLRATAIPLPARGVGLFLEDLRDEVDLTARRDQWTADVAHELKTPLTSIRLVIETLLYRVEPAHGRWLERLLKEVIRLTQLVEDLLCLNQFTRSNLDSRTHDVVSLFLECWEMTQPLAQTRNIQLDYQGPDQLTLLMDTALVYRAFLNLLDNAIKFSPEGSALRVQIHTTATHAVIEIIDRGPGFPPQDLDRVFERFYRADPARSRQTGGTGLGLTLVQEIIQAHDGEITAANHPLGGAWLTVRLPL